MLSATNSLALPGNEDKKENPCSPTHAKKCFYTNTNSQQVERCICMHAACSFTHVCMYN